MSHRAEIRAKIESHSEYEADEDGYVYVVLMERQTDSSKFFYVGQCTGRMLNARLADHFAGRSRISGPCERDDGQVRVSARQEVEIGEEYPGFCATEIVRLVSFTRHQDERSSRFKGRLKAAEREMAYRVAIDHNTTNVLGGK